MIPDLSAFHAELVQLPVRRDNYIYLLRDHMAGVTAVIDPADAAPVLEALHQRGWTLDYLLITHHHGDHVGGNLELKERTGCTIIGLAEDAARIPGIDRGMEAGEALTIGNFRAQVMLLAGHTLGHGAYYFPQLQLLFSGDTLFSLGCGRLFEGTPEQMFASLQRIMTLPEETWVCCTHEYTEENGRFALSVAPDNRDLQERMDEVRRLREAGRPTVPMLLGEEKKTNPFLRATSVEEFADLRRRKDSF